MIRIACALFRAVQFHDTEMVRNVALRAGNSRAKEPFLIAPFRNDRFVRFSIEHDLDDVRVRAKNPDLHVIANLVRT